MNNNSNFPYVFEIKKNCYSVILKNLYFRIIIRKSGTNNHFTICVLRRVTENQIFVYKKSIDIQSYNNFYNSPNKFNNINEIISDFNDNIIKNNHFIIYVDPKNRKDSNIIFGLFLKNIGEKRINIAKVHEYYDNICNENINILNKNIDDYNYNNKDENDDEMKNISEIEIYLKMINENIYNNISFENDDISLKYKSLEMKLDNLEKENKNILDFINKEKELEKINKNNINNNIKNNIQNNNNIPNNNNNIHNSNNNENSQKKINLPLYESKLNIENENTNRSNNEKNIPNLQLKEKYKLIGIESDIFQSKDEVLLVTKFLSSEYKISFQLLYKGSRNNFNAVNFHRYYDEYVPTLILIETFNNYRFGGFSDKIWKGNNVYKESKNSFLFSLTFKEKYNIKESDKMFAIYCKQDEFFGFGKDVRILNQCNKYKNYCNFPVNYEGTKNNLLINKGINPLIGNVNSFGVKEIEVFLVNFEEKLHR